MLKATLECAELLEVGIPCLQPLQTLILVVTNLSLNGLGAMSCEPQTKRGLFSFCVKMTLWLLKLQSMRCGVPGSVGGTAGCGHIATDVGCGAPGSCGGTSPLMLASRLLVVVILSQLFLVVMVVPPHISCGGGGCGVSAIIICGSGGVVITTRVSRCGTTIVDPPCSMSSQ